MKKKTGTHDNRERKKRGRKQNGIVLCMYVYQLCCVKYTERDRREEDEVVVVVVDCGGVCGVWWTSSYYIYYLLL